MKTAYGGSGDECIAFALGRALTGGAPMACLLKQGQRLAMNAVVARRAS